MIFWTWRLALVALFVSAAYEIVTGERIWKSIYTNIPKAYFCFRRGNGTHSFGCSSDFNSNVGVVMLADKESQLRWIVEKANAAPYTVLLTPEMFRLKNLKFLEDSGKLSGVILLSGDGIQRPSRFSSDSRCPNNPTSLYKGTVAECTAESGWNSAGSELLFQQFSFPIAYVREANMTKYLLEDCYDKFNKPSVEGGQPRDWPLCAVELDSFMYQATDSRRCLYRDGINNILDYTTYCGKLADMSIFKLLSPPSPQIDQDYYPNDSVIVVSTRIDTMSLFDKIEIGSESPAAGIVVLLAAAKLLSDFNGIEYREGVSNVLFAFLQGESFDYIGSSRMIYDMDLGRFPCTSNRAYSHNEMAKLDDCKQPVNYTKRWPNVSLSSIRNYLELGQLYSSNGLFAHVDSDYDAGTGLVEDLQNSFSSVPVTRASEKQRGLPPASLHSILKVQRETPGVLLTNFDQKMTNDFYHSVFDDYVSEGVYNYSLGSDQTIVRQLSVVAEGVASYLFYEATGKRTVFEMDKALMNELLNCYVNTKNCDLYDKSSTPYFRPPKSKEEPEPFPQYVSVLGSTTLHSIFLDKVLTYLTGEVVDGGLSADDCKAPEDQNIYRYYFVKGKDPDCVSNTEESSDEEAAKPCGKCVRTTSWFGRAMSPAYVIDDYDYEKGHRYAAWTESIWNSLGGRVFLKADPVQEQGFLACGVVVVILSFVFVFWIDRFSDEIFETALPAASSPYSQNNPGADPVAEPYRPVASPRSRLSPNSEADAI